MSQKAKTTPKQSPKNTLFNYFMKNTPKTPQNEETGGNSSKKKEEENGSAKVLNKKQLDFGELI
jgi:hypothetical protein